MLEVQPAFSGRDESNLRPRGSPIGPVDAVGTAECLRRLQPVIEHPRLHVARRVAEPDVQPARRQRELRMRDLHAIRAAVDDAGRLDRLLEALQSDPVAGIPGERVAQYPHVDDFLDASRRKDRHVGVHEGDIRLVERRRAFADMVVAHEKQHPAVLGPARQIAVLDRIAGTVHARPLRVPEREHAVVLALAVELRLLAAPYGGRRKILVHAGLEDDAGCVELLLRPAHLQVHGAQRRSAVPRNVPRGVQSGRAVPFALRQQQADDRLRAVQKYRSAGKVEPVSKLDVPEFRSVRIKRLCHRTAIYCDALAWQHDLRAADGPARFSPRACMLRERRVYKNLTGS